MRPDEEAIRKAIRGLDLEVRGAGQILKPYHWGIQLIKGIHHWKSES